MNLNSIQTAFLCMKASFKKTNLVFPIILLFSVLLSAVVNAQTKISDGTTGASPTAAPNKNAILELQSGNKGILLPRVALTSSTSPAPLLPPVAAGMAVYNTVTQNDVVPGYYVYNGTVWQLSGSPAPVAPAGAPAALASVTFYDDTTGITSSGTGATPNQGVPNGQNNYPTTNGLPAGSDIPLAASNNVTRVKKVGNGVYKVFFAPGTFKDNNYYPAITSSDGLTGSADDSWQNCIVPYMAANGSYLYKCAVSEEGLSPTYTTNPMNQGQSNTSGARLAIITKTKDYCYVISIGNNVVSYFSLVFLAPTN